MKFLKENMLDLLMLIGMIFLSIGFFMLSPQVGFIGTGIVIILCCSILWWVSRERGDE